MATAQLVKFGRLVTGYSKILNCRTIGRLDGSHRFISKTTAVLADRRYSDKHEWVSVEGKIGTVGISSYAQEALGDIVYAQLPEVGTEYKQHDECGALESVKAASEVYCPVTGTVTEKNSSIETSPGIINKSCYSDGWLFKIDLKNIDELKHLMDEKAYESYLKSQSHD